MISPNVQALFVMAVLLLPISTKAAVVSSDDLQRLVHDAQVRNDGCYLTKLSLNMSAVPEWKTATMSNGVSIKYPWSPNWYVLGKQIPWFERDGGDWFSFGRSELGQSCSVVRQYTVEVLHNETLARHFAPSADGPSPGKILESMTLNGKTAAVVDVSSGVCAEEAIAVEISRGGKPTTIVIRHNCASLTADMLRAAASVR